MRIVSGNAVFGFLLVPGLSASKKYLNVLGEGIGPPHDWFNCDLKLRVAVAGGRSQLDSPIPQLKQED